MYTLANPYKQLQFHIKLFCMAMLRSPARTTRSPTFGHCALHLTPYWHFSFLGALPHYVETRHSLTPLRSSSAPTTRSSLASLHPSWTATKKCRRPSPGAHACSCTGSRLTNCFSLNWEQLLHNSDRALVDIKAGIPDHARALQESDQALIDIKAGIPDHARALQKSDQALIDIKAGIPDHTRELQKSDHVLIDIKAGIPDHARALACVQLYKNLIKLAFQTYQLKDTFVFWPLIV